MWAEHFWMGGMWIFPIFMIIALLFVVLVIFGRGRFGPPRDDSDQRRETPLDILNKRYARGEITKEEYESIKNDIH